MENPSTTPPKSGTPREFPSKAYLALLASRFAKLYGWDAYIKLHKEAIGSSAPVAVYDANQEQRSAILAKLLTHKSGVTGPVIDWSWISASAAPLDLTTTPPHAIRIIYGAPQPSPPNDTRMTLAIELAFYAVAVGVTLGFTMITLALGFRALGEFEARQTSNAQPQIETTQ